MALMTCDYAVLRLGLRFIILGVVLQLGQSSPAEVFQKKTDVKNTSTWAKF